MSPVTNDPTDPAFQQAVKQWEDKGYKILPALRAPDVSWVQEWADWNKATLGAIKTIFGDKDGWAYFGNLFVFSLGEASLNDIQKQDVNGIRAILAKADMTFGDLGELHGRILHLMAPELRSFLQTRAPGVLSVLDILGRIGGVV